MKIFIAFLLALGVSNADKIVGGTDAGGPIPYQVRIAYSGGSIRCGGTLISEEWVLTAAHCQGSKAQWLTWQMVLGYYNEYSTSDNGVQSFGVAEQIPSKDYDSATTNNDVMVIRLNGKAVLNGVVNTAALPDFYTGTDLPIENASCKVSGWGTTSSGGSTSQTLLYTYVNVVSNEECNTRYSLYGGVTDGMLCLAADGADACQGDSGGPALCGGTIDGIVSWGVGCARPMYPGVYTRVAYYRDWIQQQTGI